MQKSSDSQSASCMSSNMHVLENTHIWSSAIDTIRHLRFTGEQVRRGETSKLGGEEDGPLLYTLPGEFS